MYVAKRYQDQQVYLPVSVPARLLASMAGVGVGGGEFRHPLWAQGGGRTTLCVGGGGGGRTVSSPREYLMPHLCPPHSPHSKVYYRPEQTVCGSTFKGEGGVSRRFLFRLWIVTMPSDYSVESV